MKKQKEAVNGKRISIQEKFSEARRAMSEAMVERDGEVDLVLTALICREHCLLVGAPGTAKSLLLDSLVGWVNDATLFKYLLTKYTEPMELFGPVDVENGCKSRITEGGIVEGHFVFLDEIFKAGSSILNTLLKLLNERTFKYFTQEISSPLRCCVAASNEWPDPNEGGKELAAMFDRFLLRKTVKNVSWPDGERLLMKKAINNDPCEPVYTSHITLKEIDQAHSEAMALDWSGEARKAFWKIREEIRNEKIYVGNRRLVKAFSAARAYAYLNGAKEVLPFHLSILQHVLWDDPSEDVVEKCRKIISKLSDPMGETISEKMAIMGSIMETCKPVEAATKLKSLREELEKIPADPRRDRAIAMVKMHLNDVMEKIVGVTMGVS